MTMFNCFAMVLMAKVRLFGASLSIHAQPPVKTQEQGYPHLRVKGRLRMQAAFLHARADEAGVRAACGILFLF